MRCGRHGVLVRAQRRRLAGAQVAGVVVDQGRRLGGSRRCGTACRAETSDIFGWRRRWAGNHRRRPRTNPRCSRPAGRSCCYPAGDSGSRSGSAAAWRAGPGHWSNRCRCRIRFQRDSRPCHPSPTDESCRSWRIHAPGDRNSSDRGAGRCRTPWRWAPW